MSIRYANVAISLCDNEGKTYIYGYVPIIVAKCGVYLKEMGKSIESSVQTCRLLIQSKATDVEGIFRLSGSEKRIKELREAFNSPDRYGKGLDWSGYTVHDAANILRRYFNQLPEPIIPLDFYDHFRDPIRNHQEQAVGKIDGQSPSEGKFDVVSAIKRYQELITTLPPLNRQLLLYILDLLAVFASKSDINKMTTANLAAIFQPGILSHPNHDMAPPEYRLSQDVLIFLIENQDHFLIGMQGTAADPQTVQEVQSGPPTPATRTPGSRKSLIGRSESNASKYSGVRRSVSVSSKHSRSSIGPTPITPTSPLGTPGNGIGIHRSNTVPSKRSPALPSGRIQQRSVDATVSGSITDPEKHDIQTQPASVENVPVPSSEKTTPSSIAQTPSDPKHQPGADPRTEGIAIPLPTDRGIVVPGGPGTTTPGVKTTFKDFLSGKSPPSDGRKPNKLQKKRLTGSQNPSANSSSQSLEVPTGADQLSIGASTASNAPLLSPGRDQLLHPGSQLATPTKLPPTQMAGGELKPSTSPTASFRSHSTATEPEGLDQLTDAPMPAAAIAIDRDLGDTEYTMMQRKRYWFSRNRDDRSGSQTHIQLPLGLGQNDPAQRSRSSVTSAGGGDATRKSMTVDRSGTTSTLASGGADAPTVPTGPSTMVMMSAGEEIEEKRGERNPITWIKGKVRERAEKREEKRAKSPTPGSGKQGSLQNLAEGLNPPPPIGGVVSGRSSGRSFDLVRGSGKSMDVQRVATTPAQQQQEKAGMEDGAKEK